MGNGPCGHTTPQFPPMDLSGSSWTVTDSSGTTTHTEAWSPGGDQQILELHVDEDRPDASPGQYYDGNKKLELSRRYLPADFLDDTYWLVPGMPIMPNIAPAGGGTEQEDASQNQAQAAGATNFHSKQEPWWASPDDLHQQAWSTTLNPDDYAQWIWVGEKSSDNDSSVVISCAEYWFEAGEGQPRTVRWAEVFVPKNDPATADRDESQDESLRTILKVQSCEIGTKSRKGSVLIVSPTPDTDPKTNGDYYVVLLPFEFEIIHTETDPATGNPVNPGKDKVLRDEIVDLRIKIPPLGGNDWTVDLTIEPEAMRTQDLPTRGDVQMYDFGQIEPDGTVTPDKTQFVLKASEGGERTIKAVFNKAGKLKIKMKSTDGKIDFTSPEYTVEERIRKYAIPYVGYGSHDPNQYDQEFVDAAKHWGDFYGHQIDTVDRLKAMAVPESDVGANPDRPNDILTVGHPGDDVLETIRGNPVKWDYDKDVKQACDQTYKKLNYTAAGIGSTREAIKWGVLWLYHKAMTRKNNPAWTWEKRNVAPLNVLDENEEPEFIIGNWDSWSTATQEYNAKWPNYASERVGKALYQGLHYNAGANNKIWPIRSNKSARP